MLEMTFTYMNFEEGNPKLEEECLQRVDYDLLIMASCQKKNDPVAYCLLVENVGRGSPLE